MNESERDVSDDIQQRNCSDLFFDARMYKAKHAPRQQRRPDVETDSGKSRQELRSTAKMINYALLYGKTAFTLSKDIGVTPQAAIANGATADFFIEQIFNFPTMTEAYRIAAFDVLKQRSVPQDKLRIKMSPNSLHLTSVAPSMRRAKS